MAKDPAFLFYPGDWQLGTMHMTLLEKGCYLELLVLQFAKGKFTEAQAKHMLNGSFDLAWATLVEKFETDGTFFWNKRLMLEKERRKKFTDSRKSNGSVKKENKHMLKHMENENINIDEDIIVLDRGVGKGQETKPSKYNDEYWDSIKKKWLSGFSWKEKVCRDFKILMPEVETQMLEFLSGLELKEDYKNIQGLKSHFVNWYKKHKINGSKANQRNTAAGGTKLGTSDARVDALRKW